MKKSPKKEQAPDTRGIAIQNLEGEKVDPASLWADRCIVLDFLRHFG